MSKPVKISLGLLVSAACLWLSFRHFDWVTIPIALEHAIWRWLPLTILVYVSAHIWRAIRWTLILSPVKKVSPVKLFFVLMFGFFMNNILPARAGEIARAYAASKLTGAPASTCLGSIALERLTDMIGFLFLFVLSVKVFALKLNFAPVLGIALGGFALAGVLFVLLPTIKKRSHHIRAPILTRLITTIERLVLGFAVIKSPKKIFSIFLTVIFIWILEALGVVLMSRIFGLNLSFLQGTSLMVGLCFGVMIPASPGYVGTYEFFGQQSLVLMGYDPTQALTFIIMLHFFQLAINSLLGVPLFIKLGASMGAHKKEV